MTAGVVIDGCHVDGGDDWLTGPWWRITNNTRNTKTVEVSDSAGALLEFLILESGHTATIEPGAVAVRFVIADALGIGAPLELVACTLPAPPSAPAPRRATLPRCPAADVWWHDEGPIDLECTLPADHVPASAHHDPLAGAWHDRPLLP